MADDNRSYRMPVYPSPTYLAARVGDLTDLKRMHALGHELCPALANLAAAGGHIDILVYLKLNAVAIDPRAFDSAARYGRVNVLQWIHDQKCAYDPESAIEQAMKRDRRDVADAIQRLVDTGRVYNRQSDDLLENIY